MALHSGKHFSAKSCYSRLIPCGPHYWARTVTAADTWRYLILEEFWSRGQKSFWVSLRMNFNISGIFHILRLYRHFTCLSSTKLCPHFCHAASGDVLVAEVPVHFLKKEPKVEEIPMPTTPPPTLPSSPSSATPTQPQTFSPEDDPLPGTASLMSRPRGRGRPRKIKPEVELHLRTAKIRRRRRSSVRSGGEDGPGSPNSGSQDLTQAAFQSWLSQSQEAVTNGTCSAAGDAPEGNRPEESVKEMAEKQGQWFNLLPKQPCDDNSLTEPQIPNSPGSSPKLLPQISSALPALTAPLLQVWHLNHNYKYIEICCSNWSSVWCLNNIISSHLSRTRSCLLWLLLILWLQHQHRTFPLLLLFLVVPHQQPPSFFQLPFLLPHLLQLPLAGQAAGEGEVAEAVVLPAEGREELQQSAEGDLPTLCSKSSSSSTSHNWWSSPSQHVSSIRLKGMLWFWARQNNTSLILDVFVDCW